MRACLQRVHSARVLLPEENNKCSGEIERGFLVLLGVGCEDTKTEADLLARKIFALRVFEDEQEKMNLDLSQVNGSILVVSQFTLFANCRHGRRPSYTEAAPPEIANELYLYFVEQLRKYNIKVETGVFRALMNVELVNDGPVTIWLDTDELK